MCATRHSANAVTTSGPDKQASWLFDLQDHQLIQLVNSFVAARNMSMSLAQPEEGLHPRGIIKLTTDPGMRIARAVIILLATIPVRDSLWLVFLLGMLAATALEYVTGAAMEALFKVRYWDYSHKKFNFQGQICLESSLAWGLLTILMTRMIHKPIEAFALWLPSSVLTGVTMVVTVIFAADFALSFKAALDLRDVLVRMEQAKDELEKMQRRLDVILAVSEENWENRKKEWNQSVESTKAGFAQRRDELVSGIEKRFERAKELLPSGRLNVNREELFDLRSKFGVNLQRPELASFLKDFTKRDMLRGNPGMVSKKFSEALEELKKSAVEYKKREKK